MSSGLVETTLAQGVNLGWGQLRPSQFLQDGRVPHIRNQESEVLCGLRV